MKINKKYKVKIIITKNVWAVINGWRCWQDFIDQHKKTDGNGLPETIVDELLALALED